MHCSIRRQGRRRRAAWLLLASIGWLAGSGAAWGADSAAIAAGSVSGGQAKDSLRRAALAGGIAPLSAAAATYYMDVQELKLRNEFADTDILVSRAADEITLTILERDAFAIDGAELTPGSHALFDRLSGVLRRYEKTLVEIAAYAEGRGSREQSQQLADRRAAAVAAYLEARGIGRSRVFAIGAAGRRPVDRSDRASSRARNRRVELTLSPIVQGG